MVRSLVSSAAEEVMWLPGRLRFVERGWTISSQWFVRLGIGDGDEAVPAPDPRFVNPSLSRGSALGQLREAAGGFAVEGLTFGLGQAFRVEAVAVMQLEGLLQAVLEWGQVRVSGGSPHPDGKRLGW